MTAPRTVAEVLDAAADLLTSEGAWTQGAQARRADGKQVMADGPNAVCWCLIGATEAADPEYFGTDADRVLYHLLGVDIVEWNDAPGRTQAEVVAKLREAATLAREQGK
ncbi:MAG: DUF6197 family protein [Janthinobacterium lividum]